MPARKLIDDVISLEWEWVQPQIEVFRVTYGEETLYTSDDNKGLTQLVTRLNEIIAAEQVDDGGSAA